MTGNIVDVTDAFCNNSSVLLSFFAYEHGRPLSLWLNHIHRNSSYNKTAMLDLHYCKALLITMF